MKFGHPCIAILLSVIVSSPASPEPAPASPAITIPATACQSFPPAPRCEDVIPVSQRHSRVGPIFVNDMMGGGSVRPRVQRPRQAPRHYNVPSRPQGPTPSQPNQMPQDDEEGGPLMSAPSRPQDDEEMPGASRQTAPSRQTGPTRRQDDEEDEPSMPGASRQTAPSRQTGPTRRQDDEEDEPSMPGASRQTAPSRQPNPQEGTQDDILRRFGEPAPSPAPRHVEGGRPTLRDDDPTVTQAPPPPHSPKPEICTGSLAELQEKLLKLQEWRTKYIEKNLTDLAALAEQSMKNKVSPDPALLNPIATAAGFR
jgi:hypothetical protein